MSISRSGFFTFFVIWFLSGYVTPLSAQPRALAAPALPGPPVASYRLEAALDPETHQVRGAGTVVWRNASRAAVSDLYFHLYLNAFRNSESTWLRESGPGPVATLREHGWGWIEVERLETDSGTDLLGGLTFTAPDDGNDQDRTLARVKLPRPVPPGGTLRLRMEFTSQLPRAVARTGFKNDYHLVAQWFPKVAALGDDGAWHAHQFHANSEFFADFGAYDVTLVTPPGVTVGATGRLEETRETEGGLIARRYVQESPPVHDFAWTAWSGFVEHRSTFTHEDFPEVELILLLRPDTGHLAERYAQALRHGLRLFGTWYGPYPYPALTLVDPPFGEDATGGMEYPTLITAGTSTWSPAATQRPEGVTLHELAHQWFQGLVATDEFREPFLDEGLTTYASQRALAEAYGPRTESQRILGIPWVIEGLTLDGPADTSARYFRGPSSDPIARTAWGYLDRNGFRYLTYSKMALVMAQLERTLGRETFDRALGTYARRYRFRHPTTEDLMDTLEEMSGQELTPFFRQTIFGSGVLDMAVTEARTRRRAGPVGVLGTVAEGSVDRPADPLPGWESEVVVRRLGEVSVPVTVEFVFEGGVTKRRQWNGQARWVRYRMTGPRLLHAVVDPDEQLVLDVDRLNDSRRTEPDDRGSRRFGHLVRFWVQNLLETFAGWA